MRIAIVILILICIGITSCFAGDCPTVTAEVNIVDGFKQYIYTLTNDLDSGAALDAFYLYMPKAAASIVTGFTSSGHWRCYPPYTRGIDYCMLRAYTAGSYGIVAGQSITFILNTPASVPASYTYTVPGYTTNWACNMEVGNTILPVPAPVPEPSSILALAGGIAGLAGSMLRRRR